MSEEQPKIRVGVVGKLFMVLGMMSIVIVSGYLIYRLLPLTTNTSFCFLGIKINPGPEAKLIVLVMLSGALGSFVHAATSFTKYVGLQMLYRHWMLWYFLRPFIGGSLALILYFVIRGGLLTSIGMDTGGGDMDESIKYLNVYGIMAISALSGMFSKQAIEKLREIFDTLFQTRDPEQLPDAANSREKENKAETATDTAFIERDEKDAVG